MRPEVITNELIDEICNHIAAGFSYAVAAKLAGISESTFFRWLAKGQMDETNEIYMLFYLKVQEASEFSEAEALQLVRATATKDRNWKFNLFAQGMERPQTELWEF